MKPTLPPKVNVEKNGSQSTMKFFDFVQAALLNVVEVTERVLEGESFKESEQVATYLSFDNIASCQTVGS